MSEKTYYERKIRYLDLLEQGERISGAGFLKTEVRGKEIGLFITVRGLHPTDTYDRDVTLQMAEGEINIGQISLKGGQGQFSYHADMAFSELRGIRIVLGGTREIQCKLQEEKKVPSAAVPDVSISADTVPVHGLSDIAIQADTGLDETSDVIEVPDIAAPEMTPLEDPKHYRVGVGNVMRRNAALSSSAYKSRMAAPAPVQNVTERNLRLGTLNTEPDDPGKWDMESSSREETQKVQKQSLEGNAGRRRKAVKLMEDKWQQISAIYPHVHPFRDEREYLSISPADFVMLTSKAYRAANNSFLLHGYYNYDHLILAKIEKRGEVVYYIGVPGSYYEREKQVAVMFGFESFECGTEPAQAGDFGYYMMRTEL